MAVSGQVHARPEMRLFHSKLATRDCVVHICWAGNLWRADSQNARQCAKGFPNRDTNIAASTNAICSVSAPIGSVLSQRFFLGKWCLRQICRQFVNSKIIDPDAFNQAVMNQTVIDQTVVNQAGDGFYARHCRAGEGRPSACFRLPASDHRPVLGKATDYPVTPCGVIAWQMHSARIARSRMG